MDETGVTDMSIDNCQGLMLRYSELEIRSNITVQLVFPKQVLPLNALTSGLYYKLMTLVNDNYWVVKKLKLHLLTMLESSFMIVTC
jgi:hypothetical protein